MPAKPAPVCELWLSERCAACRPRGAGGSAAGCAACADALAAKRRRADRDRAEAAVRGAYEGACRAAGVLASPLVAYGRGDDRAAVALWDLRRGVGEGRARPFARGRAYDCEEARPAMRTADAWGDARVKEYHARRGELCKARVVVVKAGPSAGGVRLTLRALD